MDVGVVVVSPLDDVVGQAPYNVLTIGLDHNLVDALQALVRVAVAEHPSGLLQSFGNGMKLSALELDDLGGGYGDPVYNRLVFP